MFIFRTKIYFLCREQKQMHGLMSHIIQNPRMVDMPEHKLMEGIINTRGLLSDFQHEGIEGIIRSLPEPLKKHKRKFVIDEAGRPVEEVSIEKGPNATKTSIGFVRFQGSRYH
jgi:hypothetical protein